MLYKEVDGDILVMKMKQIFNRKGFTLIELLVVVAIIGILAGLIMGNFLGAQQRARDGQRKSDLRQIQSALELYRADNGSYPSTIACGAALSQGTTIYMRIIPCDPRNSSTDGYTYSSSTPYTTYSLTACLENGQDGSGEPDATICPTDPKLKYTVQNP